MNDMNESERIFISEVQSGIVVEKEYCVVELSGKKGLFDASDPKREILPCVYDSIGFLESYIPLPPGITIKRNGLLGYFCNGGIIVPCEFNRIEVGVCNDKSMELIVEREGLKGIILVDLTNNTSITRIPVEYQEIRCGNTLVACKNDDVWSIYSRSIRDEKGKGYYDRCYFKKGEFKTITIQFNEPYPINNENNKILLPLVHAQYGIDWKEVDKIEEVRERHCFGDSIIRTIFTNNGKLGLWDNRFWRSALDNCDQLISIENWEDEDNEDRSLFMIAKDGKAGVYNIEHSCYVLNLVYEKLSYQEETGAFLTSINGKQGILSKKGSVLVPHIFDTISLLRQVLKKDYGLGDGIFNEDEFFYSAAIDDKIELFSQQGTQIFKKRYDKIEIDKTRIHRTESIYFYREETLIIKVYEERMLGLFIETNHDFLPAFECEYDSIVYVPEMDVFVTKKKDEIKHITFQELIISMKLKGLV